MRGSKIFVAALMAAVTSGLVLFAVLGFMVTTVHPRVPHDRSTSTVSVDGVSYTAANTYALAATVPRQARTTLGLPAHLPTARRGDIWLATFVTASNGTPRTLPTARRFALQDAAGHVYAPVSLRGDPDAYAATRVAPGQQLPLPDTPAAENLAGEGDLLLFQIPRSSYAGGLSLSVFDPAHRDSSADFVLVA